MLRVLAQEREQQREQSTDTGHGGSMSIAHVLLQDMAAWEYGPRGMPYVGETLALPGT